MFTSWFGLEKAEEKAIKIDEPVGNVLVTANEKNSKGKTALHKAVKNNNLTMTQSLVSDKSVNINAADDVGETPLHLAVLAGNVEIFKFLLANGASDKLLTKEKNKNSKGIAYGHPGLSNSLHYAFYGKKLCAEIISILAQRQQLSRLQRNQDGLLPFHLALSHADINLLSAGLILGLVVWQSDIEIKTLQHKTSLHLMVENKNLRASLFKQIILDSENNFKKVINECAQQCTPFFSAIQNGDEEKARILLEMGANPNIGNGTTFPLHLAIRKKMNLAFELVEFTDKVGTRDIIAVEAKDASGHTPLVCAAQYGNEKVIDELKKRGVDFSGPMGELAVREALLNNQINTVIKLISYGANPDVHVRLGHNNKFSFGCSSGDYNRDMTGMLQDGDTPLHFAVKTENKDLALACLSKKPGMVNSVNAKDKTPAHTAIKVLSPEMANLLKINGAELKISTEAKGSDERKNTLLMQGAKHFGSGSQLVSFFSDSNYQLTEGQKAAREKMKSEMTKQPEVGTYLRMGRTNHNG